MSEITLPCKVEPWDGRIVDANDMYVDSGEVLLRVNNHERLVELLAQCSTELAESIEGKYQGILGYPSTDRDYRTDMAIVEQARTLLAALEAEKGGEL